MLYLLALAALPLLAGQTQSVGSVIIYEITKDGAVVAADSRKITTGDVNNQKVAYAHDDACKVFIVGNRAIAAYSGYDARAVRPGLPAWRATEILRIAASKLPIMTTNFPKALSESWKNLMTRQYQSDYDAGVSLPPGVHDNLIAAALVIGFDSAKNISFNFTRYYHDTRGVQTEVLSLGPPDSPQMGSFGASDIQIEYSQASSARSRQWHTQLDSASPAARVAKLVQLTAEFSYVKLAGIPEVGGEVDLAQVDASGPRWISHKKTCPAQ
jgi:hypothetical protein